MEEPYIVYAKTDAENRITDINSSAFLSGTDGRGADVGREQHPRGAHYAIAKHN